MNACMICGASGALHVVSGIGVPYMPPEQREKLLVCSESEACRSEAVCILRDARAVHRAIDPEERQAEADKLSVVIAKARTAASPTRALFTVNQSPKWLDET